ncbi:sel1 repeat family protein [Rhizobium sp. NTR19]|uniref:Sel1 repeat family protein n=1 Tax=Neorhizobium turbinariae TaxID=2937795 RepID=A0ABT0IXV6_9HYPH|nr:tetratricopeptide repeat protein [Neorhizobium turbinariae]MCK8782690.1 sel1 repeat family protein [Neorhizobium turbinariae]
MFPRLFLFAALLSLSPHTANSVETKFKLGETEVSVWRIDEPSPEPKAYLQRRQAICRQVSNADERRDCLRVQEFDRPGDPKQKAARVADHCEQALTGYKFAMIDCMLGAYAAQQEVISSYMSFSGILISAKSCDDWINYLREFRGASAHAEKLNETAVCDGYQTLRKERGLPPGIMSPKEKFRQLSQDVERRQNYVLALRHQLGEGVPKDLAKGAELMFKAADAGLIDAQIRAGHVLRLGNGVPKDFARAMYYYGLATGQGRPESEFAVAMGYLNGWGVLKDEKLGFDWMLRAANLGHLEAEWSIARSLEDKDPAQSAVWHRKAAERGHGGSQFVLGYFYSNGTGVPQDEKEAFKWYKLAADGGMDLAYLVVASRLWLGIGTETDVQQAYRYAKMAAESSNEGVAKQGQKELPHYERMAQSSTCKEGKCISKQ